MKSRFVLGSCVFLATLGLLVVLFGSSIGTAFVHLFAGWLSYVLLVLPQVHVRWDGLLLFAIGYGLCVTTAHWWMSWFIAARRELSDAHSKAEGESRVGKVGLPWRWRHSFAVVTLFLTMFLIVIAMAGVTHQAGWLASSPTSWHVSAVQSDSDNQLSRYRIGFVDRQRPGMNWIAWILPYLPYRYPEVESDLPWNDPRNAEAYRGVIPELLNPRASMPHKSPDGFGLSHFAGNLQLLGAPQPVRLNDIELAGTLLVGEVNQGLEPWGMPGNCRNPTLGISPPQRVKAGTPLGFGSPTRWRSTAFAQLDGSVVFLNDDIDPEVLRQLSKLKTRLPK